MKPLNAANRPYSVQLPSFGISAFTSRHGVRFRMPLSRYAFHKIVFIVEGRGVLRFDTAAVELGVRTVARVPAAIAHRFEDDPESPMTLAVLCVTDAAARQLPGRLWADAERVLRPGAPAVVSAADIAAARQAVRQISIEAASPGRYVAATVAGHATILLSRALDAVVNRVDPMAHTGIGESLQWLDRHFTQRVRIDDLAARAGMSYRTFTSAFRAQTGQTVVQYVSAKRLALAKRLIHQTGDILTSSIEAGFNDLSQFYRGFAKHFGHTPGQWRTRGHVS